MKSTLQYLVVLIHPFRLTRPEFVIHGVSADHSEAARRLVHFSFCLWEFKLIKIVEAESCYSVTASNVIIINEHSCTGWMKMDMGNPHQTWYQTGTQFFLAVPVALCVWPNMLLFFPQLSKQWSVNGLQDWLSATIFKHGSSTIKFLDFIQVASFPFNLLPGGYRFC